MNKWESKDGSKRGFSKYGLYAVIIGILLGVTVIPLLWKAVVFKKTEGVVVSITFTESAGRRKKTNYYPVVEYVVNNRTYKCLGSRFQHEELYVGDKAPVIYDPEDPANGYVYNFLGYWAAKTIFAVVATIFLTLLFQVNVIPDRIKI